jgi:hypothetical protein
MADYCRGTIVAYMKSGHTAPASLELGKGT